MDLDLLLDKEVILGNPETTAVPREMGSEPGGFELKYGLLES